MTTYDDETTRIADLFEGARVIDCFRDDDARIVIVIERDDVETMLHVDVID